MTTRGYHAKGWVDLGDLANAHPIDPERCYLCGQPRTKADSNKDHVPPKRLFQQQDRANGPLIIRTHSTCNNGWSDSDEELIEFIAAIEDHISLRSPLGSDHKKIRVDTVARPTDNGNRPVLFEVDAPNVLNSLSRWLQAFHLALYGVPISTGAGAEFAAKIYPPFAYGRTPAEAHRVTVA